MSAHETEESSNPIEEEISRSKKKKKNFRWWDYFDIFTGDDGVERAKCKNCPATYKRGHGTKNLIRHVSSCKLITRHDADEAENLEASGQSIEFRHQFDESAFRESLAKAIVMHEYPFQIVEHEGLANVFRTLNPEYKGISRNTAKADVLKLYRKEKSVLKEMLQTVIGRISVTTDLWTSITTDGYLSVTAHYVDNNWRLQKKLLCFREMPPPHSGIALAELVSKLLNEWSIESKLFSVTVDNASSNDVFVDIYKDQLNLQKVLLCQGLFFHVRCVAHVLNLIVQDGLKEIDPSIIKVRESVKYIKGSQSRRQKFQECVEQLDIRVRMGLRQDVPTKWNSTYLMLESAFAYRHALHNLSLHDKNYVCCPSFDEWSKLEKIYKFLKVFYDCTNTFSGTLYPTSNLFFNGVWKVQWKLNQEINSCDEFMERMAKKMQEKFDKYWKNFNLIFAIAVVLDPRYKMKVVEYAYSKIYGEESVTYIELVRTKMYALYEEYKVFSMTSDMTSSMVGTSNDIEDEDDSMEDYDSFVHSSSIMHEKKSQLDLYLDENPVDRKQPLDILKWWQANEFRFGELSKMARDILAVPVSTVASEAAFSVGGRVLDEYRSTLTSDNVEAIICTRDWLYRTQVEGKKTFEVNLEMDLCNVSKNP